MSLAVLLIIGAAVVGPIDAQIKPEIKAAYESCVSKSGKDNCPLYSFAYEDVPELCARAMKEIGAREMPAGFAATGTDTPRIVNVWLVDGLRVTCIPVPEGYRR